MYDSFVFYASFHEACKELSAEQYGRIMFVLNEYALNGVVPESFSDPIVKMAFTFMKPQIDANNARKEAGSKGGRPSNRKPMVSNNTENTKPVVIENDENSKPVVSENNTFEKPNVNANANVNVNANDIAADAAKSSAPSKPKKAPLREREPENDCEAIEKAYLYQWDQLYNSGILKTPEPPSGLWAESRAHIKQHLKNGVTVEQLITAVNEAVNDDWIMRGGYLLKTILSSGVLNRLINGRADPVTYAGKQLMQNDIEAMNNLEELKAQSAKNFEKFSQYDSKKVNADEIYVW